MRAFLRRGISAIISRPRPIPTRVIEQQESRTSPTKTCTPRVGFGYPYVWPSMERVNIRCVEEDEIMTLTFSYADMKLCLQREKNEKLDRALTRIRASVLKKAKATSKRSNKKFKKDDQNKKRENEQNTMEVSLHNCSGKQVDISLTNDEAWQSEFILIVGSLKYSVHRNPPTVKRLTLPGCAVVGCTIFPRMSVEFAENVKYQWYRGFPHLSTTDGDVDQEITKKRCSDTGSLHCNSTSSSCITEGDVSIVSNWEEVGTEMMYTPVNTDAGSLLKLECIPISGTNVGLAVHCVLERTVCSTTGIMFPFEKRHNCTAKITASNSLRIVSYNILADLYADSDYSREVLYAYCPPEVLHIDYREQLIIKEITGYNADFVCLQETGKRLFENALVPSMKAVGLEGLICYKHAQPEGEAIFYRASKFRFVASHDLVLSNAFQTDALYGDLLEVVSSNEAMLKRVVSRSSVVQVAVFEDISNPSRKLCVANTHLYFHPRAGHVRLIQTAVITRHLEHLKKIYKEQHDCENLAVILCCDLNSTPGTGAFELVSTGSIAKYAADWYSSGKEEFCGGIATGHSLKLDRPYKSATYTNYVSGFQGVLDYIFYEHQYLDIEQEVPLPTHADVIQNTALPSQVFPSDHLALVCDLKWNS